MSRSVDPLLIGQRIVAILETGQRDATYKLATLMALIDHCIENLPSTPKMLSAFLFRNWPTEPSPSIGLRFVPFTVRRSDSDGLGPSRAYRMRPGRCGKPPARGAAVYRWKSRCSERRSLIVAPLPRLAWRWRSSFCRDCRSCRVHRSANRFCTTTPSWVRTSRWTSLRLAEMQSRSSPGLRLQLEPPRDVRRLMCPGFCGAAFLVIRPRVGWIHAAVRTLSVCACRGRNAGVGGCGRSRGSRRSRWPTPAVSSSACG